MIAIKFDNEKLMNVINIFEETHGRKPYIICNENTMKQINCSESAKITRPIGGYTIGSFVIPDNNKPSKSIKVGDAEYILKEEFHPPVWHGSKILIDPDLEYGEIHIG